jgi:NAD(P)-dependent dehydrogenase (short-subunit alcohol dehydrogenase family)
MNSAKLALVTGANQGIGLETCRQLKAAGWQVVLTSRDEKAGHAAARDLGVDYHQLDVTSADSIATLVTDLGRERRRIDLLVNNAGISMQGFDTEVVRETLAVNFFGALHVTEALLPLIADGGAIVMVSSGMGELHAYAPAIRARFADPSLSRDQLVALVEEFAVAVAAGDHAAKGWPSSAYRVSKAAIVALAKVLARDLAARRIRVNAVCPGWVRTRMGGSSAPRKLEQGARSVVATAFDASANGGFFRDGKAINW